MAKEIERKFLVTDYSWQSLSAKKKSLLEQGYFPNSDEGHFRLYILINPEGNAAQVSIDTDDQHCYIEIIIEGGNDFANLTTLPCYNKETGEFLIGEHTDCEARIRTFKDLETGEEKAKFTLKYHGSEETDTRDEFEIEVPYTFAKHIFKTIVKDTVQKERTMIDYEGHTWEVDSYLGENTGLITADVEVSDISDLETLKKLPGTGKNVSDEHALRNKTLIHEAAPQHFKIK